MEAESTQIVKPDRTPDYVSPSGHAFWWPELVFMHALGGIYQIKINQENGEFEYVNSPFARAKTLHPEVKVLYDKWWYETFESKVLDSE